MKVKQERHLGKHGGHVEAFNALLNDAVYDKTYIFQKLIIM